MKKWLFLLSFISVILGGALFLANKFVIIDYEDDLISYDYGIVTNDKFLFLNLKINALNLLEGYPSELFQELALINNKKHFIFSGWVVFAKDNIDTVYLYNKDLGSLYLKSNPSFTRVIFTNKNFFGKAVEFYSRSKNILPSDINYSKVSYNQFRKLAPSLYTALDELDTHNSLSIITHQSIEEIFMNDSLSSLINSEWYIDVDFVKIAI